jgi:hypothetical protein
LADCFDIYRFLQDKIEKNSQKINEVLHQQVQKIVLPEDIEMVKKNRSKKKKKQNLMYNLIVTNCLV